MQTWNIIGREDFWKIEATRERQLLTQKLCKIFKVNRSWLKCVTANTTANRNMIDPSLLQWILLNWIITYVYIVDTAAVRKTWFINWTFNWFSVTVTFRRMVLCVWRLYVFFFVLCVNIMHSACVPFPRQELVI